MRPQTVIAICSVIPSCLPYLVAGVLIAAMTTLLVRTDLVAEAIAEGLRRHPAGKRSPPKPIAYARWTEVADRVLQQAAGIRVPSAVRIQLLVNRLRAFETERLEPLEKCLNAVSKRLLETTRKGHRIQTAVKLERLQAIASWSMLKTRFPATRSIAANTDDIALLQSPTDTSAAAADPSESDVEAISRVNKPNFVRVAKSTSGLQVASRSSSLRRQESPDGLDISVPNTSLLQHEMTLGRMSDESVERPSREPSYSGHSGRTVLEEHRGVLPWRAESLEDVVWMLAENALSAATRLINACQKYWRTASKICRVVCSAVYSERSRLVARWAFGVLEKLVNVTADVRVADGTTRVSFELVPATEHVVNISYI